MDLICFVVGMETQCGLTWELYGNRPKAGSILITRQNTHRSDESPTYSENPFESKKGSLMKSKVVTAVNSQINAELESAYIYLGMSARMEDLSLPGLAQWLRVQWEEEIVHAMKFYDFLVQRGESVELGSLKKPAADFKKPLEAFEEVLKHEQYITDRIWKLNEIAVKEKDYALQSLLKWFIDEQVEEEDNARAAIDALRLVGDDGSGLFLFDREMGQRTAPPAETGSV